MLNRPTVIFNELTLNEDWWITSVARPKPQYVVYSNKLDGADGSFYRGMSIDAANVKVALAPKETHDLQSVFDVLMEKLMVSEPTKLMFSDEGGRYRLVVPTGLPSMEEWVTYKTISVEFYCPHPALYGDTKEQSITTSSTTIKVEGTYPASVKINCDSATPNSSNLWGVQFDNKEKMIVPLEQSGPVVIDGQARTVSANSQTSMITLTSDWVELAPGSHTVRITNGSGNATLEWTERWL